MLTPVNTNYDSTPTHGSYGGVNGPLQFCRTNLLCSPLRSNKRFVSKIQSTMNLITKCLHPTSLTRLKKPANSQTDEKMAQHLSHCNTSLPSAPRFTRSLVSGRIPYPKSVHISCLTKMAHKFAIKTSTTQHGGSNH